MRRWWGSLLLILATACPKDETPPEPTGPNTPPTTPVVRIAPMMPTSAEDLLARIDTASTDAEGDTLTTTFRWLKGGVAQDDLTTDRVPSSRTAKGDSWMVEVVVNDGRDNSGTARSQVEIKNSAPSAGVTIAPANPLASDDLTATATTGDSDGDAVTVSYKWSVNGTPSPIGGQTIPAGNTAPGQRWTVTATPNDGTDDGPAATATVRIENSAPQVGAVRIEPAQATSGDELRAVPSDVTDADGDQVTVRYRWQIDGVVVADGLERMLAAGTGAKGQSVVVYAIPNDGQIDGPETASAPLVLGNGAPIIASVVVSPATGDETTTFTCVVDATDPDGDPLAIDTRWVIINRGTTVDTATLTGASFDKHDVIACEATAGDGEVSTGPERSAPVSIANALPTVATATIGPANPSEADVVTVAVSGWQDADPADTEDYRYVWKVNNAPVAATPSLDGASFNKGDVITVDVVPHDGEDTGAAVTSNAVTAVNTPPVVASVTLGPAPAFAHVELVATPQGWVDPDPADNQAFNHQWLVNGQAIMGVTGGTLASSNFTRGDVVRVVAEPFDSDSTGPSVADEITIVNSPPTAAVITIEPSDADHTQDLRCLIGTAATDADGDAVQHRYSWTVDGAATAITSSIAPASETRAEQSWVCTVVASDGTDDGPEATASVVVQARCDSLELDGVDDRVTVAPSATFDYGTAATVEAWVAWDGITNNEVDALIFGHRPGSESLTLGIFHDDTGSGCQCPGRSAGEAFFSWGASCAQACLRAPAALSAGGWHHVAGVVEGSTASLFVDGVLVATTTSAVAFDGLAATATVTLGGRADGVGAYFGGHIDVVRVSTVAQYLADFSPDPALGDAPGTVALWTLSDAAGAVASDHVGGHDGLISGGAAWSRRGPACLFDAVGQATRMAQAFCQHRTACEPAFYGYFLDDEAQCISERTAANVAFYRGVVDMLRNGRVVFDDMAFERCITAFATADCEEGVDPDACDALFVGQQPRGQPCGVTTECAPGNYCTIQSFGECATCQPYAVQAASCASTPCGDGMNCLDVGGMPLCIRVDLEVGATCGTVPTGLCRGRLQCAGPTGGRSCQRPAQPAAMCDPAAVTLPACNIYQDSICTMGRCQEVSWVDPGSSCAPANQCNVRGRCDQMTGQCVAWPTAGQACYQGGCAIDHYCAGATCAAQKGAGQSCASGTECLDDLFCLDSVCQPYQYSLCE